MLRGTGDAPVHTTWSFAVGQAPRVRWQAPILAPVFLSCQIQGIDPRYLAPANSEEGGGAAKKRQRGGGGVAAEPGNGVPKKESAECPHQRRRSTCKECGGGSICPHQRERSLCKERGGSSICPLQRIRSTCKECGVGGKRPAPVAETQEGGGAAKKQRRVKLQAILPPHV